MPSSMRIDSIELYHLSMRLQAPFETSFGLEHDRECIVLCLRAGKLAGWGECVAGGFPGFSYETVGTAWHVLDAFFVPALLGQELPDPRTFRELTSVYRGHPLARAGLEMALWDLSGKARGLSLQSLLGGTQSSVAVGVSVGLQPDLAALQAVVEAYVAEGYRRVKLKIKPRHDLALVEAIRSAFPRLALQVDANAAYGADQMSVFEAMDEYDLLLIEQPLSESDWLGHCELQARLKTPLCLDESIGSRLLAAQALELGACRVINIKPGRVGGLTEAMAIHDLCLDQGFPVWCGGMLETGIGRAANLALASLPGFTLPGDISASDRYYAEDIAHPRFQLNADSTIDVPQEPGLGVEVSMDALEKVTVRREIYRSG